METKIKTKAKDKKRRVPVTNQLQLLGVDASALESGRGGAGEEDFINPRPEAIFIGNRRLRDYLMERGLGEVIYLREFIFGSDLGPFLSGYSSSGRRAIHPGIMLSLIMYGIMEGKWSLRELEELAIKDVCAWWLCGGEQPDHSTIGKFINRFAEILTEDYFVSLTQSLSKALKISCGAVAGDGTVIEAVSSRYRAIKKEAAAQALAEARAQAAKTVEDSGARLVLEQAQSVVDEISEREETARKNGQKRSPAVCPNEPEAVIQPLKNKCHRPSYKPCVLANEAQMIVGQSLQASDEGDSVAPMLKQHQAIFNRLPLRALFDAGYHNYKVLSLCVGLELDTLCPPGRADRGNFEKQISSDQFAKSDFSYDPENDLYRCPEGKELRRESVIKQNGQERIEYRCKECSGCAQRGSCTKDPKGRRVSRYSVDEYKEAMRQVFESEAARKIYGQRKAMVEPVISQLKCVQRLDRFHRKGLRGAGLELALHCDAHNLKKAIKMKIRMVVAGIFAEKDGSIRLLGVIAFIFVAEDQF